MSNILEEIGAHKLKEIAAAKAKLPLKEVEAQAAAMPRPRGFAAALQQNKTNIIAELKKASPSKGLIRAEFNPEALAKTCESNGAACLSVLTDENFFQGSENYLQAARNACTLPIIQKDFFYDPYQVIKARALGADAILLIMAALSPAQAEELAATAKAHGLDILPEVHNEEELAQALSLKTKMIGINNRDLKTFTTDLAVSERLAPLLSGEQVRVCESGIHTRKDIERMKKISINAFLVGESLMKQPDVGAALKELLDE